MQDKYYLPNQNNFPDKKFIYLVNMESFMTKYVKR